MSAHAGPAGKPSRAPPVRAVPFGAPFVPATLPPVETSWPEPARRRLAARMKFRALPLLGAMLATTAFADSLLVLNKFEHTLALVDPATLQVTARIPVGVGPHEVAVTADGKTAVVCNYGAQTPGNSLSVIDLATQKETQRVDLGGFLRPHGIQEVKGKFYFTSELSRTVARFDPASGKLDWVMGHGQSIGHMLVVTPDGKQLYTANILSNNVTALALGGPPTPASITHIAVGPKPEAIDVSPDGQEAWVGHNDDGGISVIATATNQVVQTFTVGQMPIRIKFTPDGTRALVSDPKAGEFLVVDAKSRTVLKRVPLDGAPVGILIQPDGKRAYVARMQAGTVAVFDLEKLEFVADFKPGEGPDGLAWAPAAKTP
jgi:YVTN family beta-propeller protein